MVPPLSRAAALRERLRRSLSDTTGATFLALMERMSSSDRRAAGALLAGELLPALTDEAFWALFEAVVPGRSKVYLMTFTNAWLTGYKRRLFTLNDEAVARFSEVATDLDRAKMAGAVIRFLRTPEEVGTVVERLLKGEPARAVTPLINAATLPAYYRLFLLLRRADPDEGALRAVALQLMVGNEPRAMRFAEIIQRYFSLAPLPGRFAVTTDDYRLSRLDLGYEAFCKELAR